MRKAVLAGALALALSCAGAAFAWSANPPSPPGPQSAPGQENKPQKQDKSAKAQRHQLQHSESVVKNADGAFQTVVEQRGTVEAVGATSITVISEDGFSQAYAVNGDTTITKAPGTGGDGKRLRPEDGTIADITTGELVRISGLKKDGQVAAEKIAEGAGDVPGLGLGRGNGHGLGKAHGQGRGPEK
ncbi:hypothetical protein FDW83_05475 [Pseudarthrobacter sp. NamE2]|nr:hypothetical protein FDW83_05475 [Pseudarthrobacter sp. NamE2]